MSQPPPLTPARPLERVAIALGVAALWTLLLLPLWRSGLLPLLLRTLGVVGMAALLHAWLASHPVRLQPTQRRRLQCAAVLLCIPLSLLAIYLLDSLPGRPPLWRDLGRLTSLYVLSLSGLLLAGLCLLAEQLRLERRQHAVRARIETEALLQTQSELHDAQLRLLRSQLRPQMVLDLVRDARERLRRGAPDADAQLGRLVDYLQGALPQQSAQHSTLQRELELATSYLTALTDPADATLRWQADVPEEILATRCPPRLLLVLIEHAARLGLGLPEGSGWIDIWARAGRGRCVLRVSDSGQLDEARHAALDSLRRRLLLAEGEAVRLQCWARENGGSVVEVDFPISPSGQ